MTDYHKEVVRGEEAKRILDDPMVRKAIEDMRADACNKIRLTKPDECVERDFYYYMLKVIDEFEKQFSHHIDTGKLLRFSKERIKKIIGNSEYD